MITIRHAINNLGICLNVKIGLYVEDLKYRNNKLYSPKLLVPRKCI